jgi:hypothetical protein
MTMARAQGKHSPLPGVKPPPEPRQERLGVIVLLALGLAPRLVLVTLFPTRPVSDFQALLEFGLLLGDVSLSVRTWHWEFFSPGLPLLLALLSYVPAPLEDAARLATAIVTGLLPLLPFGLWRGVLPFRLRLLTGGALALWPGQILFSGVVAQDNWVLLPAVALACLAVRAMLARGSGWPMGWPVAAGLLYTAGVAFRQEMLVVLFPLFVVAAGLGTRESWTRKRLVLGFLAAGLPLLLLASWRFNASGRFALTSGHAGLSTLGAYLPGSTANGWTDPAASLALTRPELARDRGRLQREAGRLALGEIERRPRFHAARIVATTARFLVEGEATNLYWSLLSLDVLPEALRPRAAALAAWAAPLLKTGMAAVQALFLAAVILAAFRRNGPILLLALAVLLKVGLHAVTVTQGRYFLAVTALQVLAIALGAREAVRPETTERLRAVALSAGIAVATLLFFAGPPAMAWVQARDMSFQETYRFTLKESGSRLDCTVERGRLTSMTGTSASIEPLHADPLPGEAAEAACRLTGPGRPAPLALRLFDAYAPGGFSDRIRQRVWVDGALAWDHDLAAEPGTGWTLVPLETAGERKVLIQVLAVRPESGSAWGKAASTTFEINGMEDQEER